MRPDTYECIVGREGLKFLLLKVPLNNISKVPIIVIKEVTIKHLLANKHFLK